MDKDMHLSSEKDEVKIGPSIKIGPSGNSDSFYKEGYKHTYEAARWVADLGLNAFEYSFGHGVSIKPPAMQKIKEEMEKYGIQLSAHAPYYTNFANPDLEMIEKSFKYMAQSIAAVKLMGGNRVVVHPGSVGELSRAKAVELALSNLERLIQFLDNNGTQRDCLICIETMGRHWQIGTLEEVLQMVKPFDNFIPCIDFGHINSYTHGGIKTKDDYKRILDLTFNEIGEQRAKIIHIHFSKIMYNKGGEVKHLTFADTEYGPEYLPLAEIIEEYRMSPTIICESMGTMAEDALEMKKHHKTALNKFF